MLYSVLLLVHVVLATAGFVGLLATNAWLLALTSTGSADTVIRGIRTWRRLAQIFGPCLGAGVLAGFAVAGIFGISLASFWLLVTYALVVIGLAAQAAIMVPWQFRAMRTAESGAVISSRPIAAVVAIFCVLYVGILSLMLMRPA